MIMERERVVNMFEIEESTNTVDVLQLNVETIRRWENEVFICIECSFGTLHFGQGFQDDEIASAGFRNVMDIV